MARESRARARSRARRAKRKAIRARRAARKAERAKRQDGAGKGVKKSTTQFIVRDTATGRILRTQKTGERISDVKLKERARVVASNIEKKKLSEKKAREQAKLSSRALAEKNRQKQVRVLKTKIAQRQLKIERAKAADKKKLAEFRKKQVSREQELRKKVLGQKVTKLGEVKDFFGKTRAERVAAKNVANAIGPKLPNVAKKYQEGKRLTLKEQLDSLRVLARQPKGFKLSAKGFKAAPKEIGLGFYDVAQGLLVLPLDITKAGYKFGVDAVKEAQARQIRTIDVFAEKFLKANKNAIKARKFIQDNPKEVAILVGASAASAGKSFAKNLEEKPVRTISAAAASWIVPAKIGRGFARTPLGRALEEARFIGRQPKDVRPFVREIVKGAKFQENLSPTDVKRLKRINFNEVEELNKIEARALKKTLQETDSFVFGSLPSRAISRGKTPIPKDVDLATANKDEFIKKFINNLPKKNQKGYTKKGEKLFNPQGIPILDIKGLDRLRPGQGLFSRGSLPINERVLKRIGFFRTKKGSLKFFSGKNKAFLQPADLEVPVKKLQKIEGIKVIGFGEQTTRKGLGTIQILLERNARRAKDASSFITGLKVQLAALEGKIAKTSIVNPLRIPRKLTATRLRQAIKILESKSFARQLEKAVPGLNKEYPILKKLKDVKPAETTSRAKKIIDKLKKTKLGKAIAKRTPKKIKKAIKKVVKKKKKPTVKKISKKKTPSKLPSKIPKRRLPSRIPSRVPRRRPASKIPSKTPSKTPSRVPSRTPSKTPSKVPSRTPTKTPSKVPSKTPSKTPSKLPSKVPSRLPARAPLKQPAPTKRPIPLTFDSQLPRGTRLKFDIVFRERKNASKPFNAKTNKVVTKIKKLNLPLNKAIKKGFSGIDSSTQASAKLVISGTTTVKDIKRPAGLIKKFRIAKTKNALKFVERNKNRIDTKGEKRGLSLSKALAKKKKTKKKVKKKKK